MSLSFVKTSFSIKERQKHALIQMLHFNRADGEETDVWKVLIYDKNGSDIIAPLLSVGDLREHGVTFHKLIHKPRQPIPDVPAIFFVEPTRENILRICEDCRSGYYSDFFVNFTSSIATPLLEEFAAQTSKQGTSHLIQKIHDQMLDFISLEDDLFTLSIPRSFSFFNNASLSAEKAEASLNQISESLLSVVSLLGSVPVICAQKGGAAEILAHQLDSKLRDYLLQGGGSSFISSSASSSGLLNAHQRPIMLLTDRIIDITVMLQHSWTYQPIIHDVLGAPLNRVKFESTSPVSSSSTDQKQEGSADQPTLKTYDLDSFRDDFWATYRNKQLPDVAEAVHQQLEEYKAAKRELKNLGISETAENFDNELISKTKDLKAFASNISSLTAKKKRIDMHFDIAKCLLGHVRTRQINVLTTLEEALCSGISHSKGDILNILQNPSHGTLEDKIRLVIVYYLSKESASAEEAQELLNTLSRPSNAINFLKSIKQFSVRVGSKHYSANVSSSSASASSHSSSSHPNQKSLISKIQGFSGLGKDMFSFVQSSVLSPSHAKQTLYVTRVLEALMENKQTAELENFLFFDPKHPSSGPINRKATTYKQAICFVIGGGCYVEYHNIQDFVKASSSSKTVIYGSTTLYSPTEFLSDLEELSKQTN